MRTHEENERDLLRLRDILNDDYVVSQIIPKNALLDTPTLLVSLPADDDVVLDEDGLPTNLHVAMGYVVQLGEEEEDLKNKYLIFTFFTPHDVELLPELEVLQAINDLNQVSRMGCFYVGELPQPDGSHIRRVQYRLCLGAPTQGFWTESLVTDAAYEMGAYYEIMSERLDKIGEEAEAEEAEEEAEDTEGTGSEEE